MLLYILLIVVIIGLLITFIIYKKRKRSENEHREEKTAAMIDQMSLRRAAINTGYLEKDFFNNIKNLVYSYYSQSQQYIPNTNILPEFYTKWFNDIKREFDLGIKKTVYSFNMDKAKVVKQDNSSMYAVTRIEVEAQFTVDFYYAHSTMQKRSKRQFKQRFVFLNTNNSWLLENALPEESVNEEIIE